MKILVGLTGAVILIIMMLLMPSAYAYDHFNPMVIALDNDGNVYALVGGNATIENSIHVFAPDGKEMIIPQSHIFDIATDGQGNIYILNETLYYEQRNISIMKMEPSGTTSIIFHNNSSEFNPGYMIGSIAVDEFENLYIYDFYILQDNFTNSRLSNWFGMPTEGSNRIVHLDSMGNIRKVYTGNLTIPLFGKLRMSVDANGTIYVSNYSNIVKLMYPDGTMKTMSNKELDDSPYVVFDVSTGQDGFIYLAEGYMNYSEQQGSRIQKFSSDDNLIATWDGCGPEPFMNAYSVIADKNGRVYVADPGNQRIVWFDSNKYMYIENSSDNVDDKGLLWDNVVAGDNFTLVNQKVLEEMGINMTATPVTATSEVPTQVPAPGLTIDMALVSIMLIGIIQYAYKGRR